MTARPYFSWQYLGGWVVNVQSVGDATLDKFAAVGGKWVVVVLINDDASGPTNRALIDSFKERCYSRGIAVGLWANGLGGDPLADAEAIADFGFTHDLSPIVLDCEGPYQYPGGNTALLPVLLREVRKHFPRGTRPVGHTTNSVNDSMIFNGRTGSAPSPGDLSHRDLGIRVLPQWYNAPAYGQGEWARADENMAWLRDHGAEDNLHDPGYADGRALPLSWVKGILEVTGLENAGLAAECGQVKQAKTVGYDFGISVYTLDNIPDADFATLAYYRGILFKG